MALIKCYECQKEISDQSHKCPNCGAKTVRHRKQIKVITSILVIIGLAFSLIYCFNIISRKTQIAEQQKNEEKIYNTIVYNGETFNEQIILGYLEFPEYLADRLGKSNDFTLITSANLAAKAKKHLENVMKHEAESVPSFFSAESVTKDSDGQYSYYLEKMVCGDGDLMLRMNSSSNNAESIGRNCYIGNISLQSMCDSYNGISGYYAGVSSCEYKGFTYVCFAISKKEPT